MDVLIVMCLGIIVGRFIVPNSAKKWSELTSIICTFILILSMGIKLGKNENFLNDLSTLGLSSLLFFFNTYCSINNYSFYPDKKIYD